MLMELGGARGVAGLRYVWPPGWDLAGDADQYRLLAVVGVSPGITVAGSGDTEHAG
jgi:hypothetical protein